MHRFWDTIIEPVLEMLQPKSIVEIGSDDGKNTRNLLEFCERTGATLHAVDPLPKFDVVAWQERYKDISIFHQSLSLNAIPKIERFDVILIDGDHNWYTVFNELKLIEKKCTNLKQPFPLVMLHDTGWPYGRRDLYYDPETIPPTYLKPYKKKGMKPGSAELLEKGGLNSHLCNAIYENDLQNGVLTAIEDFMEESEQELEFVKVPALHGLGILFPLQLKEKNAELQKFFKALSMSPVVAGFLEQVEKSLIEVTIGREEKGKALKELEKTRKKEIESLQASLEERAEVVKAKDEELTGIQRDLAESKGSEAKQKEEIESLQSEIREQSQDIKPLIRWIEQLDHDIEAILKSRRWRFGNTVGELLRGVMFKAKEPNATDHLEKIRGRFKSWRKNRKKSSSENQDEEKRVAFRSTFLGQDSSVSSAEVRLDRRSQNGDIIVCIHNAPDDVRKCLDALERHTNFRRHRLILVDDGSKPETTCIVVRYVARLACIYIRNERARGYTKAANQGIAASSGDFVILLNSDTIVTAGWIDKLIDCAYSMPNVACVGPLSNAASWQSIPELTDENGKWHVNELPENADLASYAEVIATHSPRLYPEVPFINGFCYLITRQALNKVGLLDEVSFPNGYGEEDDFSIRALDTGFCSKVADDCYVYHAKCKSFTAERREQIVAKSKQAIATKHEPKRVFALLDQMRTSEDLLRARVAARLAGKIAGEIPIERDFSLSPLTIGWFQPHLETVGGIRRAIEMTNRLLMWGNSVVLITPEGKKTTWMPIAADAVSFSTVNNFQYDVLIVSDPDVIEPFLATDARLKINYHLAACMLYREANAKLKAYYGVDKGIVHIANSSWNAEQVQGFCNIQVEKIIPGGIDRNIFHPVNADLVYDIVCYGSKRIHKGTDTIDSATRGLKLLYLDGLGLHQNELARQISSARVFASACLHEGFNFCPLEAMACGIPVAMTDDGGSREYARDGENALIVEPGDEKGLSEAIHRLIDDVPLRLRLIENGMETAWRYDWDKVSAELIDLISERLADRMMK